MLGSKMGRMQVKLEILGQAPVAILRSLLSLMS
jgi:hypothetical protein